MPHAHTQKWHPFKGYLLKCIINSCWELLKVRVFCVVLVLQSFGTLLTVYVRSLIHRVMHLHLTPFWWFVFCIWMLKDYCTCCSSVPVLVVMMYSWVIVTGQLPTCSRSLCSVELNITVVFGVVSSIHWASPSPEHTCTPILCLTLLTLTICMKCQKPQPEATVQWALILLPAEPTSLHYL